MPITFSCTCGKTLRVPDASAGKRAKCPACAAVVSIPAAPASDPVLEVVEDPVAPPAPAYKKPFADANDDSDDGGTYGIATPERDEPASGGGKSNKGAGVGPKKLPNFRIGFDNHK